MRGKYYQKTDTIAVINIIQKKGEIPFKNKDDLIVRFDSDRKILIMKRSDDFEI